VRLAAPSAGRSDQKQRGRVRTKTYVCLKKKGDPMLHTGSRTVRTLQEQLLDARVAVSETTLTAMYYACAYENARVALEQKTAHSRCRVHPHPHPTAGTPPPLPQLITTRPTLEASLELQSQLACKLSTAL
jgi:chlorite dismutase